MKIAAAFATLRSRDDADMSTAKSPSAHAAPTNARRPPFDSVTICLHWATVLLVLAMFASAWLHSHTQDDVLRPVLLQIHRSLGMTIWIASSGLPGADERQAAALSGQHDEGASRRCVLE